MKQNIGTGGAWVSSDREEDYEPKDEETAKSKNLNKSENANKILNFLLFIKKKETAKAENGKAVNPDRVITNQPREESRSQAPVGSRVLPHSDEQISPDGSTAADIHKIIGRFCPAITEDNSCDGEVFFSKWQTERIAEEATRLGYKKGMEEGFNAGYDSGEKSVRARVFQIGYEQGKEIERKRIAEALRKKGKEIGNKLVKDCFMFAASDIEKGEL